MSKSMLRIHVHASAPSTCRGSMSMLFAHVYAVCCMSMSILYIHVRLHGLEHAALTWTCSLTRTYTMGMASRTDMECSIDMGMQHEHGLIASTGTCNLDMNMQHGHGHAAWTWTWTCTNCSMCLSMLHVHVHAACYASHWVGWMVLYVEQIHSSINLQNIWVVPARFPPVPAVSLRWHLVCPHGRPRLHFWFY
jgi:hypothetical protein